MTKNFSVIDNILITVKDNPTALAIESPARKYTYKEYYTAAAIISFKLQSEGVGSNDKIAVLITGREYIPIALLAILMSGATYVPIDPNLPQNRLKTIINEITPKVVLTDCDYEQISLLSNDCIICKMNDSCLHNEVSESFVIKRPAMESIAYIFYTSGSTGTPKGVELSYSNLQFFMDSAQRKYGLSASDTHLGIAKYTFSISLFDLLLPFYCSGSLIICSHEDIMDPKKLAQHIAEASCFHVGPSLLGLILRHAEDEELVFSNIRHISSGGDMIAPVLLEQCKAVFPEAEIWVIYGCTEVACMAFTWQVERESSVKKTYIGHPFEGVKVKLINERQEDVVDGEYGEILIAGNGTAKGYINRQRLNEEKFLYIDGYRYYKTGDIAVKEASGQFRLLGRKDFQIQINGVRIEEGEIEHWLRKIKGIQSAIVVGAKDKRKNLKLVAFVQLSLESVFNASVIKQILVAELPSHMIPAYIVPLENMLVNSNGKVDRKSLISLAEEKILPVTRSYAGDNKTADTLERLWDELGISVNQPETSNFFESGGDSLNAAELAYKISSIYNIHCNITTVYDFPVFSQQLDFIFERISGHHSESSESTYILPLDDGSITQGHPIFILPGMGGHSVQFHNIGLYLSGRWKAYGLNYPEFNGENFKTFESVAKRLLEIVKERQPVGPYYLCGHSLGGVISFEMARLLKQQEEEVFVILFDARIWKLARSKSIFTWIKFYYTEESLSFLVKSAFLKMGKSLHDRWGNNSAKKSNIEPFKSKVNWANTNARNQARLYDLSPCNVPAVLIKCDNEPYDQLRHWLEDYGWNRYADLKGIIYSRGSHYGMLDKENRQELAKNLERSIASLKPDSLCL
ncbi:MAG: AMP-binding protein [Pseudomonadales bacterium]|nr:AMP-binding protein [Pseudomonadales bacterium]